MNQFAAGHSKIADVVIRVAVWGSKPRGGERLEEKVSDGRHDPQDGSRCGSQGHVAYPRTSNCASPSIVDLFIGVSMTKRGQIPVPEPGGRCEVLRVRFAAIRHMQ